MNILNMYTFVTDTNFSNLDLSWNQQNIVWISHQKDHHWNPPFQKTWWTRVKEYSFNLWTERGVVKDCVAVILPPQLTLNHLFCNFSKYFPEPTLLSQNSNSGDLGVYIAYIWLWFIKWNAKALYGPVCAALSFSSCQSILFFNIKVVSSKATCDDTICAAGMFQIVYSPHIKLSDFLEDPLVKSFRNCQNVYCQVKRSGATLRDIM